MEIEIDRGWCLIGVVGRKKFDQCTIAFEIFRVLVFFFGRAGPRPGKGWLPSTLYP